MIPALALVLSLSQAHWAETAFNMGEQYGNGYLYAAIVGEESSWCRYKVNSWSRGCAGLKRSTARIFDPPVTRKILTQDNQRNLTDGLLFLLQCKAAFTTDDAATFCFHWGEPHTRHATAAQIKADPYVKAIHKIEAQLRALPVTGE